MTQSALPEFRTDVLTGLQVLIAPSRASRPSAISPEPLLSPVDDPFAEGMESETPCERFSVRDNDSKPDHPGWKLRVVPNRFPAVLPDVTSAAANPETGRSSLFPTRAAIGEHDVVIECPDGRSRLAEFTVEEMQRVLSAWRTRIQQLTAGGIYAGVSVFRNEGFSAGASLAHCHSQIIATRELSPLDAERHSRASAYLTESGRDLISDVLDAERLDGRRLICESSRFLVFSPFAPRSSWHTRFVPVDSGSGSFADVNDLDLRELAELLKQMLFRLEQVLQGPFSFNLILPHPRLDEAPRFRWMLDLLPRTGRSAGWEFLSSVEIVTVAPEQVADLLRS